MSDNNDFEDELAKSIAQIVNEETTGAEVFVKNSARNQMDDMPELEQADEEDIPEDATETVDVDDDIDDKDKGHNKKRNIIIIASVAAAVIVIVLAAFFIIRAAINKTHDNYAYYNNLGYEAYDTKDYETAIVNFEKALTYDEGKKDIDMMLYLYDCYYYTKDTKNAVVVLKDVLEVDSDNFNALYYLVQLYSEDEDYDSIAELYDTQRESDNEKVVNLFSQYTPADPVISPEAGSYGSNQNVKISAGSKDVIYYTLDGKKPTVKSTEYDAPITIEKGTTTLSVIAVSEYGIISDVVTAEYDISYTAPAMPTISPSSGSYSTSAVQLVTIGNIPSGGTAYYTTDGSTPTGASNKYTAPFEMKEGSSIISAIVIDANGLTSPVASVTYTLSVVDKYTDTDAQNFIWTALESNKIVNSSKEDEDGNVYSLSYYSKKTVSAMTIWMFTVKAGDETLDYYYGADATTGEVYKLVPDGDEYKLTRLKS